ncbi:MAG: DNA primase [Deltaproteobacteria bacterium]|nr:DNA primase [Deltaproteobacteria bacterium]
MGGRISESTIREIREKADIVSVVSETVSLSRSGASFRGLCPFHREKTPSFFVHPSRQVFKCFGCGEGGSVIHFLMKARNLAFAEAVEDLGERYGVPIQYERGPAPPRPGEDLYRILKLASETYRDLLRSSPGGKAAKDFLRRRGVAPEAEQEFFLGYGGQGKDVLDVLSREGIDPGRAAQAGLLFAQEGGGYRERFRGRLIYPITDARGRVCGFGARAINDATPKYLNSPESDLYRKSSVLYGLFQALPAIRNEKKVVVVEGYMDLIGLWQRGVRNVVATCGTSLTESHARTLKRLSDTVILLFDGDVAGKRSAVRAGGPLYAAGVSPLVLFPPKGMDPDDWAKETAGAELAERIARAIPLMEYIERAAARKYDLSQIAGKLSYLGLMGKYLPWITDPAEYRMYVQRVAQAAGLPEETVLERLRGKKEEAVAPAQGIPPRASGPRPEEDLLLCLLSRDPSLIEEIRRDGVPALVEGEDVREAIALLARQVEEGGAADIGAALDAAAGGELRKRISEEMFRGEIGLSAAARRIYPDVVLGLKIRKLTREIARLGEANKAAIRDGETARAQDLFTELKAAKNEKERLERERRMSVPPRE